MDPPPQDLLALCAAGDQRAWATLVDRYGSLVYSVPRRMGLPDADCDDVFQAVFEALWPRVGQIRDPAALPKWLITTAHRETWRVARHRRTSPTQESPDAALPDRSADPPADLIADLEDRQAIRESLAELGGRCEKLLRALFAAGEVRPYADIARELGVPIGSLGPTRARCLSALLELVRERLGSDRI